MRILVLVIVVLIGAITLSNAASADLVWLDGTKTNEGAPPGKLLSDNPNYWGDCVLTGVEVSYESSPEQKSNGGKTKDKRAEKQAKKKAEKMGISGAVASGPLVLVLDFKRNCTFSEVDILTRTQKIDVKLECGSWGLGWRIVYERKLVDSPDQLLHRIKLPEPPKGDRLRLTVSSDGPTSIGDVWVWGDAEVTAQNPEAIRPIVSPPPGGLYHTYSIRGIERTAIKTADLKAWTKNLGDSAKLSAVWSKVSTWNMISGGPIMPTHAAVNPQESITMARNETECAAFALSNTSVKDTLETDVSLGEFKRVGGDGKSAPSIKGKLSVMGAIPSAVYGVCMSPLLEKGNMPGASLLKRYLTNSDMIKDFPHLTMPLATSAIVWLSVTTDGAQPGKYEASLDCAGGSQVSVQVEVVDVTLPHPFAFVESYSRTTEMMPFEYADRNEREVAYKHQLGITVWNNFPEAGSPGELARKLGTVQYNVYALPRENRRPTLPFSDNDKEKIMESVRDLVKQAKAIGLSFDEWFVEFYDEPGEDDMPVFAELAKLVKEVNPNIKIYCNPLTTKVGDWYGKYVDVSFPTSTRLGSNEPLFSSPRWVNGFYRIQSNSSKSESITQVNRYRGLAWEAMSRGWNGWGFFAYYRPTGNPWNDFDGSNGEGADPDYAIVYPGPRGPVATRASESLREGYEDYCLISLLRQQGKNDVADSICKSFTSESSAEKRSAAEPLDQLRLKALRAAAK